MFTFAFEFCHVYPVLKDTLTLRGVLNESIENTCLNACHSPVQPKGIVPHSNQVSSETKLPGSSYIAEHVAT